MSETQMISSPITVREYLIVIAILVIGLVWRIWIVTSTESLTEIATIHVASPIEPEIHRGSTLTRFA